MVNKSKDVSKFLKELNHPLIKEIEQLRIIILNAVPGLTENIKWNGPNYCFNDEDRITMKIQPPKKIQLIFHRGAKKLIQPKEKLIKDYPAILEWRGNDRAIASFDSMNDIQKHELALKNVVEAWIEATK